MKEAHVYPRGCFFSSLEDIKGKKITVMGLGLNGGGEASVRFFLSHGACVTVTDMKSREELLPTVEALEKDKSLDHTRLRYVLGEHRLEDFSEADCVIKNPGVRFEGNKFLEAAKAVETDLSIFLNFTKAPVIAVTGSKGKSSTVSAIHYGLCQSGFKAFLGGNITVSPLTFLEETNENTPVVLELSSWQLRDLRGRGVLKPHIALITKIVPDHQNFYGDMDSYVADKCLIFADQTAGDYTILDAETDGYQKESSSPDKSCKGWGDFFASKTKATVLRYGTQSLAEGSFGVYKDCVRLPEGGEEKILGSLLVPGRHNRINVLNAALVLRLMGVNGEKIQTIMGSWKGIPHRLERFHEWKNNKGTEFVFFNDSCATVPEASAAASQSFEKPVILLAGGTDKELDFVPLARTLNGECGTQFKPRATYLLSGSGTDKLLPLLEERKVPYEGPFDSLGVLLAILKDNIEDCSESDSPVPVVFSPGATSFGMFKNEFDRGNQFKELTVKHFC